MAWNAKNTGGYSPESDEGKENCNEIAQILFEKGWTKNAVAAMLGAITGESGLNPWRWQSDDVPTRSEYNSWSTDEKLLHGYGLEQFTPASKYIESSIAQGYSGYGPHFADETGNKNDGAAQMEFLDYSCRYMGEYIRTPNYYLTYDEFIATELTDFDYLVRAWNANYLRGVGTGMDERIANAEYIFTILGGKIIKPWLYIRRVKSNGFIPKKRIYKYR